MKKSKRKKGWKNKSKQSTGEEGGVTRGIRVPEDSLPDKTEEHGLGTRPRNTGQEHGLLL